jgi:hypothetical protein
MGIWNSETAKVSERLRQFNHEWTRIRPVQNEKLKIKNLALPSGTPPKLLAIIARIFVVVLRIDQARAGKVLCLPFISRSAAARKGLPPYLFDPCFDS